MMLPNPFICNILCDDVSGNQVWATANFQGDARSACGYQVTLRASASCVSWKGQSVDRCAQAQGGSANPWEWTESTNPRKRLFNKRKITPDTPCFCFFFWFFCHKEPWHTASPERKLKGNQRFDIDRSQGRHRASAPETWRGIFSGLLRLHCQR